MLSLGWMEHYVGTIVGEETISSASLTIYFFWIEGVEVSVVVVVLCLSFEQTVKRMNFPVGETNFRCFCGGAVVGTTSSIL
jgi:hypothetical protein